MKQDLFIGIDSGTSSIKAVVFDLVGNELYTESMRLAGIFPADNQYEEDMNVIFDSLLKILRKLMQRFAPENIKGIGITAQGDGLWLIDQQGNPVRNGCCFCDGRAGSIIDEWVADGTCKKLFDATGTRVFSGNQNAIVKWFERNEKTNLEKAKYFLHLKDYLFYKLTGMISSDPTDQSLIFLDLMNRTYLDDAFSICDLEKWQSKYPPVLSAMENKHVISKGIADLVGLPDNVLITSGPMDVSACALGSGVIDPGDCCSIIGTAALHEKVIDTPLQDTVEAGMTITHVMEKRWLRLMASLAGTPNVEWMLKNFGTEIIQEAKEKNCSVYQYMEDLISSVEIGADGIIFHPYLLAGGERAPFTNAYARASYTGLCYRHDLSHIIRATYEGVAYAMLDCYLHMPGTVGQITLCGGGAKSHFWCQMFADVIGTKIITIAGEELGAKGAVLNNEVVQGYYSDYQSAVVKTVHTKDVFHPNMKNHQEYLKYYKLYKKTYELISDTWKMRASLGDN
jgi:sugar (pentulose or hexulose) kinase